MEGLPHMATTTCPLACLKREKADFGRTVFDHGTNGSTQNIIADLVEMYTGREVPFKVLIFGCKISISSPVTWENPYFYNALGLNGIKPNQTTLRTSLRTWVGKGLASLEPWRAKSRVALGQC